MEIDKKEITVLESKTAQWLYGNFAASKEVVDFDCRLRARAIADDCRWANIAELWLNDPAKWRAMRAAGVDERLCTDPEAPALERFEAWAATLTAIIGSPLYVLSNMELRRLFDIDEPLSVKNAHEIFDRCNEKLATPEFSMRGLLRKQNIGVVCTENDPSDSLEFHIKMAAEPFETSVLPVWTPDRLLAVGDPVAFNSYVTRLGAVSGVDIATFDDLIEALQVRHNFFDQNGAKITVQHMEQISAAEFRRSEVGRIFRKIARGKRPLSADEAAKFRTAMTLELAQMDWRSGWSRILRFGRRADVNSRCFAQLGRSTGFDAITEAPVVEPLLRLLDRLDSDDHLCRTMLCAADGSLDYRLATLAGSFQNGRYGGCRIQLGLEGDSFGLAKQAVDRLAVMSDTGLLSGFAGFASQSNSPVGFVAHDLFRRTLCNVVGGGIEAQHLTDDEAAAVGSMIENICSRNARNFFGI